MFNWSACLKHVATGAGGKMLAAPMLVLILSAQSAPDQGVTGNAALNRIVKAQNKARAELGIAPMNWNSELAAQAQSYAQELAATGDFKHSPGEARRGQGENLWAGTRGAYTPDEMAHAWIRERAYFRPGRFPDISTTGNWHVVGHYTQVIWRQTSEVGCAIARNRSEDFLVCRYQNPGNVMGQTPY